MWQQTLTQILTQANYNPQEIRAVIGQLSLLSETDRRAIMEFLNSNRAAMVECLKYNLAKLKRAVILGNVRLVKRYLKELEMFK